MMSSVSNHVQRRGFYQHKGGSMSIELILQILGVALQVLQIIFGS